MNIIEYIKLLEKFQKGDITAQEFQRLTQQGQGQPATAHQSIQKSTDDDVVQKAMETPEGRQRYLELEEAEKREELRKAAVEMEAINAKFESAMRNTVRKSGITKEQAEVEYWEQNPELYNSYQQASRRLLM